LNTIKKLFYPFSHRPGTHEVNKKTDYFWNVGMVRLVMIRYIDIYHDSLDISRYFMPQVYIFITALPK